MTERIPQSTAFLVVFKAYLASDHVSEATGKTIAITISKNGGAFGNPNAGATNATEISSGWYKVSLDTTDTGTLGPLAVRGAVATIDDVGILLDVVSATSGGYTNLDAAVSAVKAKTDNLPSDPADESLIIAATDALATSIAALNNVSVNQILTTQMTESYAADGAAPTLAQALFLIQQQLGDFSISGTTITVKKIDGTTTAATYTLDSATSPTSSARAT